MSFFILKQDIYLRAFYCDWIHYTLRTYQNVNAHPLPSLPPPHSYWCARISLRDILEGQRWGKGVVEINNGWGRNKMFKGELRPFDITLGWSTTNYDKIQGKIVFVYFSFQPWQTIKAFEFLQDCLGSLSNYQNLIVRTIKSAKMSKGNIYANKTLVNQGQIKY